MKRNKFSLSHYRLLTCDMGELVPAGITEVLPGDTIQQATSMLVRCSPLLAPVMHPVSVRIHHWFVPHRLVWDDWEDFITGGPDGLDDSVFPTITEDVTIGSLGNYLGLPGAFGDELQFSALPYRGYALIFNEWYRDQDLIPPIVVSTESGPDTTTNRVLQHAAWEKDYFTSARPWEQKGPQVNIPISIESNNQTITLSSGVQGNVFAVGGANAGISLSGTHGAGANLHFGSETGLAGTGLSMNALRESLALQRYEEARARYGSRYVEYLRYLGVRSSDARLQRPEYLGGGKQTIQFSEVLQTAPSSEDPTFGDTVGAIKGHGIAALRSNRYRRFFEEHGYIFTLISVLPKTMYLQTMPRTWNRRTKEDFWQKEFQHIGQQEVLKKEIWAGSADPLGVWGYQDRYDEYRRSESGVAGEFVSTYAFWHFGRDFLTEPALNGTFVNAVPTERPFADQTTDVLWIMARNNIQARRMLARTGTSFIF